ncbi:hypothetical protein ACB094_11G107700 [Castanea mollissima]
MEREKERSCNLYLKRNHRSQMPSTKHNTAPNTRPMQKLIHTQSSTFQQHQQGKKSNQLGSNPKHCAKPSTKPELLTLNPVVPCKSARTSSLRLKKSTSLLLPHFECLRLVSSFPKKSTCSYLM